MVDKKRLETALFPICDDLKRFEEKLKNKIIDNDCFLKEDILKFMFQNPKRLRPIFIYLFSKILEVNNQEMTDNIALATEIIHSASLIHDDIIDEEELRRNNPTFYSKFGSKIAVLEGDYLLSLALDVLSCTNLKILNIFSNRIKKTILGELEQNVNIDKIMSFELYFEKTLEKTGNLFFAGLESLFVLKEQENEDLMEFLRNYTFAFQLKNDIDDILKNDLNDIKNGNYTLPVIYFCMNNSINDLSKLTKQQLEKYIAISLEEVEKHKNIALGRLKSIQETIYKRALVELCEATL